MSLELQGNVEDSTELLWNVTNEEGGEWDETTGLGHVTSGVDCEQGSFFILSLLQKKKAGEKSEGSR